MATRTINGCVAAAAAAVLGLAAATPSYAEVKATVDRNEGVKASTAFKFEHVPSPAKDDAATKAKFTVIGEADANWAEVGVVHDGATLTEEEEPAANFFFNRRLQDVVFAVDRAYYMLDAAYGLERAAERNLELARTVLAAADQRLDVGLATRPEVLLAKQVETRAVYDPKSEKCFKLGETGTNAYNGTDTTVVLSRLPSCSGVDEDTLVLVAGAKDTDGFKFVSYKFDPDADPSDSEPDDE